MPTDILQTVEDIRVRNQERLRKQKQNIRRGLVRKLDARTGRKPSPVQDVAVLLRIVERLQDTLAYSQNLSTLDQIREESHV